MEKMDYTIRSVQVQTTQRKASPSSEAAPSGLSGFQEELQAQIQGGEPRKGSCSASPPGHGGAGAGLVHVGAISQQNPTVSHLLLSHPDYGSDCWKIIHSEVNAQKAFRTLREGQDIFMDPASHEVVWDRREVSFLKSAASAGAVSSKPVSDKSVDCKPQPSTEQTKDIAPGISRSDPTSVSLAAALRQRIGTPYERLDCYELVVEGLKEMGVRYGGKGGLQAHLINSAVDEGLPMNAYLTGNGLIEASSTPVFDRTITGLDGGQRRAADIWKDLEPHLEQGLIVSFSTGDKGHTGVVSRYGDTWTFLNSGDIDHDVRSAVRRKGVGEEDLKSEISNWIRRARKGGDPLRIALGRLDRDKLASFQGAPSSPRTA